MRGRKGPSRKGASESWWVLRARRMRLSKSKERTG